MLKQLIDAIGDFFDVDSRTSREGDEKKNVIGRMARDGWMSALIIPRFRKRNFVSVR